MPMVNAADLLFRASNDLTWNLFCAAISCNPVILWKEEKSGSPWNNIKLMKAVVIDKVESCFGADSNTTKTLEYITTYILSYYIWLPAASCFPWNQKSQSDTTTWSGNSLNTKIMFLKLTQTG
jgi:hypothetical protein